MAKTKIILLGEKLFDLEAKEILAPYGEVIDFENENNFKQHLPLADVVITALSINLDKSLLARARRLRLIGSRTTQLRYLDLDECKRRNIQVINIKGDSPVLETTPSTAEEAMGLIFTVTRKFAPAFDSIKKGKWERLEHCGTELYEKTVGLIGFGRLGKKVAHYCQAFSTKVIAYDPYVDNRKMRGLKVRKVTLDYLLENADIVSVHATFDESTYHLLQERHFRKMKKNAYFINTARGEITDERGLLKALVEGWIAGAAVDTLANESPDGRHLEDNPLIEYANQHDNLFIVPHLGGTTKEAIKNTQVYISKLVTKELERV